MRLLLPLTLLAACSSPPPGAPAAGDSGEEGGAEGADGTDGDGPVAWVDPIARGPALDLEVGAPELTDAVVAGDLLIYAGQEQTGIGGLWAFDLSDRDNPVLLGQTGIWHLQRVCWTGEAAWGMTRQGELVRVEVKEDGVGVTDRFPVLPWGAGVDCAGDLLFGAFHEHGGVLFEVVGPAPDGLVERGRIDAPVVDGLLEGDRLWALDDHRLTAWAITAEGLEAEGSLDLPGTCRDLAAGEAWITVACGAGGVALVDRNDGQPALLGMWAGHASVRAVDVSGDHVLAAAWTELLLLDASDPAAPWLRGSEPAGSSVMAVAADTDQRAWVADWNQPFGVTWQAVEAPEVRASLRTAQKGDTVTVFNDGPAPLQLEAPDAGALDATEVPPGSFARWTLADDADGDVTLGTDDPDEPTLTVRVSEATGMQPGAVAPNFIETDLDEVTWDLSAMRGSVVFLALFNDGCPTCESEVPDTDDWIAETFAGEPGFVGLWSYGGPRGPARAWVEEVDIDLPVLADEDSSMRRDYFIPNGEEAFAANPRNYVIDHNGNLAYIQTAPNPGSLEEAIRRALDAARAE